MINNQSVTQIIFDAVENLNQQLPREQHLEKSIDTVLLGKLDSLGLINIIVMVEQKVEEDLGASITLIDERAMSQENSPFKDIKTLADYIAVLLEERKNG